MTDEQRFSTAAMLLSAILSNNYVPLKNDSLTEEKGRNWKHDDHVIEAIRLTDKLEEELIESLKEADESKAGILNQE